MPNLTLRDIPEDLHAWVKHQAAVHHRSVNKEVLALLERLRARPEPAQLSREERLERIMEISARAAALPILDSRSEDEILGYDDSGAPETPHGCRHLAADLCIGRLAGIDAIAHRP